MSLIKKVVFFIATAFFIFSLDSLINVFVLNSANEYEMGFLVEYVIFSLLYVLFLLWLLIKNIVAKVS